MARQRKSITTASPVNLNGKDGNKIAWLNIKYTEEMYNETLLLCDDSDAAAAAFIGLVGLGLDITLKRADSETFMACAYGTQTDGTRYGVSAWAATPLDTCASLVVKISWLSQNAGAVQPISGERPRFR